MKNSAALVFILAFILALAPFTTSSASSQLTLANSTVAPFATVPEATACWESFQEGLAYCASTYANDDIVRKACTDR